MPNTLKLNQNNSATEVVASFLLKVLVSLNQEFPLNHPLTILNEVKPYLEHHANDAQPTWKIQPLAAPHLLNPCS